MRPAGLDMVPAAPSAPVTPASPTFEGRPLPHPDDPAFDPYQGRWPHIHFEVFPSLEAATDDANKIATSQIALPEDTCNEVYATAGDESSVQTMQGVSLARDNVFGEDGGEQQLGVVGGSIAQGLTVDLSVPVSAA